MRIAKTVKWCGNRQRGQALVEFMLTTTFLVLLTVAILEVADFIYTYSVMADAAKEGVRYAVVHGNDSSSANGPSSGTASSPPCTSSNAAKSSSVTGVTGAVKGFAAFSLHNVSSSSYNVYVCYLDGNNKLNSEVEVTVTYQYQPFFFQWPSVTVFANSAGRILF